MKNILEPNSIYERCIKDSREISKHKIRRLITTAQGEGDKSLKAMKYLLKSYRNFIYSFVYRSTYTCNCEEDILQSAILGFIQAVRTFDYSKGTKFSTHAYNCITRETWDTRRLYLRCMSVKNRQFTEFNKVLRINNEYKLENGYCPSVAELSKLSDVRIDNVRAILIGSNQLNSINEKIRDSDIEVSEFCQDHNAIDPCRQAVTSIMHKNILDKIDKLENVEKRVIKGRYGYNKENQVRTCKEIAKELGVSRQRVSQIENKVLQKLYID